MGARQYLLDDRQMQHFITRGFVCVKPDLPAGLNQQVWADTDALFQAQGNPGNEIMPLVPGLKDVLANPVVHGALSSILGPDYIVHPHRHCHLNPTSSAGQGFHQDSYEDDQNVRHHHCRWAMAFYYAADVSKDMGPTAVLPASQYSNSSGEAHQQKEFPLSAPAGTVTIVHYDLWHRAMPNCSTDKRYMHKFLFCRTQDPTEPNWAGGQEPWRGAEDEMGHGLLWQHLWDWYRGRGTILANGRERADLLADLQAPTESQRLQAAYGLAAKGEVEVLIEAMAHAAQTRLEANLQANHTNPSQLDPLFALSALGAPAVPALIDALSSDKWWLRAAAANTLGDIGPAALAAVGALLPLLSDPQPWVRRNGVEALGTIGAGPKPPIGEVVDCLKDPHSWVRHNAILALLRWGRGAGGAKPQLKRALGDDNTYVRGLAQLALDRLAA